MSTGLPGRVDLSVYHGDTWSQQFRFRIDATPVNLSTATVTSAARGPSGERVDMVVSVDDAANGLVTLHLPAAGLAPASYEYDVQVLDAGTTTTWVRGKLHVDEDIMGGT